MAPNVFIAGQDYCDRLRYLHYGGMNVTIVDPPGGAKLVYDLLSQLRERLGSDTFGLEPQFVKRETVAPVQGAGTVQRPVQTALEVEQLAPKSSPGHRVKSRLQLQCETSARDDDSAVSIKTGDLLVVVDQHDVGSFEVDPWYRIFRRSGADIAQSDVEWEDLCKYATSLGQTENLNDKWEPIGVVIDAEYLRWKHVEISRHLSWAQTTEDLFRNFVFNEKIKPELNALRTVSHLIVRFDCDGVIHVDNTTEQGGTADLYIQKSENSEGDFIQSTPGRTPAIVAGFMAGLLRYFAQQKTAYNKAIQSGLLVSLKAALANIKVENGAAHHYELHDITSSDFPDVSDTSAESADSKALAVSIAVPSSQIKNQRQYRWSILQTILETQPAYQALGNTLEQSITDIAEAIVPPDATIKGKIKTENFPTLCNKLPNDKQTSLEASFRKFLQQQAKSNTRELQAKIKAFLVDLHTTISVENFKTEIINYKEMLLSRQAENIKSKIKTLLAQALTQEEVTEARTEIEDLATQTVEPPNEAANGEVANKIATLAQQVVTRKEAKDTVPPRNTKALAERIVKEGTEKALASIPTARFGNLMTADRQEKESFRAIANLVTEYLRSPQEKPISIGVFGAPGSGKSFGIKEVVKAVAQRVSNGGKRVSKPLTFNLSQFREYHDLVVAFHTVRDSGLSNEVPLVLFDEFDSGFGQTKLGWLQYLLAPMQDGKFLEDGHQRPLGSAIFVFIGGTCSTFEDFTTDLETKDAKDAKKPDFVSRLRGFVNIQGSHESLRDPDYMYLIRRGIHLRAMLQTRLGCKADEEIQLDEGVLNALLTVPHFRHGARSLESIIAMSQLHGQRVFRRSALPSAQQLGLHVDYASFADCFEPENHRLIARDRIAQKMRNLNGQLPPEYDFHQRIAGQIVDMIYNNGAYLFPQPAGESSQEDAEENPNRQALVEDLAKYRYYAVNLNTTMCAWEAAGADKTRHYDAIKRLLNLLKSCDISVRRGS